MMNFKQLAFAAAMVVGLSAGAMAAPITGDFSGTGIGAYVTTTGTATATNATALDFGRNGIGTNGTFTVVDSSGSFTAFTTGSMSDLLFPTTTTATSVSSPFISFGGGTLTLNFSTAAVSRTSTSITVSGNGAFTSGADTANGIFSLAINSNAGSAASTNFTFTTSASQTAVPEPISISLLGAGLIGMGVVRMRRKA